MRFFIKGNQVPPLLKNWGDYCFEYKNLFMVVQQHKFLIFSHCILYIIVTLY